jgi:hypothetical protein
VKSLFLGALLAKHKMLFPLEIVPITTLANCVKALTTTLTATRITIHVMHVAVWILILFTPSLRFNGWPELYHDMLLSKSFKCAVLASTQCKAFVKFVIGNLEASVYIL